MRSRPACSKSESRISTLSARKASEMDKQSCRHLETRSRERYSSRYPRNEVFGSKGRKDKCVSVVLTLGNSDKLRFTPETVESTDEEAFIKYQSAAPRLLYTCFANNMTMRRYIGLDSPHWPLPYMKIEEGGSLPSYAQNYKPLPKGKKCRSKSKVKDPQSSQNCGTQGPNPASSQFPVTAASQVAILWHRDPRTRHRSSPTRMSLRHRSSSWATEDGPPSPRMRRESTDSLPRCERQYGREKRGRCSSPTASEGKGRGKYMMGQATKRNEGEESMSSRERGEGGMRIAMERVREVVETTEE